MTPSSPEHVSMKLVSRLTLVFSRLHWNPAGDAFEQRAFNALLKVLSQCSDAEQDLILEILDDFIWVKPEHRNGLLGAALRNLGNSIPQGLKRVVLLPLVKAADRVHPKSGTSLVYEMQHVIVPAVLPGLGLPVIARNHYLDYLGGVGKFAPCPDDLVVFVDDFLGTGDTVEGVVGEFQLHPLWSRQLVALIAAVVQTGSVSVCGRLGVSCFYGRLAPKCFSEHAVRSMNKSMDIMIEIEGRMGVGSRFQLGYKQSEALVRMARTPNNTLPLFWMKPKAGRCSWEPPFPR